MSEPSQQPTPVDPSASLGPSDVVPSVSPQPSEQPSPTPITEQPPVSVTDVPPSAVPSGEPPVSGTEQPPVSGTEQPPASVTDQPPVSGTTTEQPPASVTDQPPVSGTITEQPPVSVTDQPPSGTVTDQPPSSVTDQPPVSGSVPPVSGTDQPPVSVTDGPVSAAPPSGTPSGSEQPVVSGTDQPVVSGTAEAPAGTPTTTGGTGTPTSTAEKESASPGTTDEDSSPSSSPVIAYTPTVTSLIIASSTSEQPEPTRTADPSTPVTPTAAALPSGVPGFIIPPGADLTGNANVGTGNDQDPVKGKSQVSILLSIDGYPWDFVYNSDDAQGQLFSTFPKLIANALKIPESEVVTYGLRAYQPATVSNGQNIGTQWIGYVPTDQFPTLETYVSTGNSPLYNQPGLAGALAAQIDQSYPIASSGGSPVRSNASATSTPSSTRKRNIIIGVCVGVGGVLWILLVYWIYRRVKRANERAVNKRLSEHMSMFSGRSADNPFGDERRHSTTPSIAASEIDDRPSSFYASPLDNYPAMRRRQVDSVYTDQAGAGDTSPTSYVNSVFGTSWFQTTNFGAGVASTSMPAQRSSQNPFDDMYARSGPSSPRMSQRPQRRSVQKTMISQPTLQGNSLEFNEYH